MPAPRAIDEEQIAPAQTVIDLPESAPITPPVREPAAPLREALTDFRLVGEAMKTYIIAERGEELILIDKHAAHERMIFDRLKSQGREIMSQSLLLPVPLSMEAADMELLEQNSALLSRLGFEIEPYGADSMILRAAPADTDAADAPAMIEEICEKLKKNAVSPDEAVDEIFAGVRANFF